MCIFLRCWSPSRKSTSQHSSISDKILRDTNLHTTPAYSERAQDRSALKDWPLSPSAHLHDSTPISQPAVIYHDSKAIHFPALDDEKVIESPTQVTVAEVHSSACSSADLQQERNWKRKALIQFCALCLSLYLEGWNDGTTGPLLPVIQRDFHVGFAVVSLLFVSNCIGFVSGAFANVWIDQQFGLGKVVVFGASVQLAAYAILTPAPSFPAMVVAYGLSGFGMSLQNAQANGFVASVKNNMPLKLGMLHAAYGLGAFSSPLLATHFSMQKRWSFHFLCSACISVINVVVLLSVFRLKVEKIFAEVGHVPSQVFRQNNVDTPAQNGLFRQILTTKAIYFMALFSLIYERNGGPSAGYISSGFFGGLTLGRVSLMWLNKLVESEESYLFTS
ncbi:major facilitator superfamily domain-containing protein [Cyathus striatus]|nr:major facilitator superfamily domain-containing protein [Cyathus striatus]